jgi:hypothetical protein
MGEHIDIADTIRDLGRAAAYRRTAVNLHTSGERGVRARAFIDTGVAIEWATRAALMEALIDHSRDPAEVRRHGEALARQMELGALLAAESRVRAWDELPERRAA